MVDAATALVAVAEGRSRRTVVGGHRRPQAEAETPCPKRARRSAHVPEPPKLTSPLPSEPATVPPALASGPVVSFSDFEDARRTRASARLLGLSQSGPATPMQPRAAAAGATTAPRPVHRRRVVSVAPPDATDAWVERRNRVLSRENGRLQARCALAGRVSWKDLPYTVREAAQDGQVVLESVYGRYMPSETGRTAERKSARRAAAPWRVWCRWMLRRGAAAELEEDLAACRLGAALGGPTKLFRDAQYAPSQRFLYLDLPWPDVAAHATARGNSVHYLVGRIVSRASNGAALMDRPKGAGPADPKQRSVCLTWAGFENGQHLRILASAAQGNFFVGQDGDDDDAEA